MVEADFSRVALLLVDIDGTLTDAKLSWGGPEVGWTQVFSARDGESMRLLCRHGVPVLPLSRNATRCARTRIEGLGLSCEWLGVEDKWAAFEALTRAHPTPLENIAYVADGREDVPVLRAVGLPIAVADAHPAARAAARYVTLARGGAHAIEEIADRILAARGWES